MNKPIEFYFDFTSPFGYFGSRQIEELGAKHQRSVVWHPIVLGFIFKVTESKPLVDLPIKGDYARMDIERTVREHNFPFNMPQAFPIGTVAATRAVLWLQSLEKDSPENNSDPSQSTALIHALYKAYFVDNHDISKAPGVIEVASSVGVNTADLESALGNNDVKALLVKQTECALQKKVFGSPFIIIDGEPFWGHDRFPQADRWLANGGW